MSYFFIFFMARDFKNLRIFGMSYDFLLQIYKVLPLLPESEFRNIFSQLQRASTSIVLNIVEGASNRSNKVFLNHLQYSYGSCREVEVLLLLCRDLNYIEVDIFENLFCLLDELSGSLFKFMRSVDKEVKVNRVNYSLL